MIPLTERKPAMLLEDLYPLRSAAGFESRLPEWLSNRVLTDLVIVGYGGVLALLGTLVNPFLVELGIGGALPRAFDPMIGGFVAAVFVLICIPIVSMDLRGLQRFRQSSRQMIVSFAAALFSLLVFVWSTPLAWSANASVVLWFLLGCSVLAVLHGVVSRYLREAPAISELAARHLAIVCGHERTCAQFLDLLRAQHDAEIRLIGVFHDTAERRGPAGAKLGRTIDDLLDYARERRIDEIFIALPWHAERRISALVERLGHLPVDLKLCPDRIGYAQTMVLGERLAGVPVATLRRAPIRDWGRIVKRAMDVALSAILLVALAPLLAAIALAIRWDSPGPALFRQKRQGLNQDAFELLKFRTMRHDPAAPFVQARADDRRVTTVGRWLRRASLDELPQLINVLRGEMSLVGPRPHPVALDAAFAARIQRYATRHRVKPGITGLAQVCGWRGETDTEEKMAGRVAHDLYYIENWSLTLDLKIIALTVLTGLGRRNAC